MCIRDRSGSGAADKPKDTTAGTLEEVHQPTAVLLPSSGTVAEYVPNAAEVEALAKLIYGCLLYTSRCV